MKPFLRQMNAITGALIISMGMSAVLGYSSILIPQLQLRTSRVRVTTQQEVSLVASVAVFPLALGSILNGFLMEKYGRKPALLFSQIPLPGWLIIAFSENIYMVYLGRFLTGWSAGMSSGLLNLYVAEIASTKYRSLLLALLNLSVNLGILSCHILGVYLKWNTAALVIFSFGVVGTTLLFLSPETPFWLILNDKQEKCLKNFAYLRCIPEENCDIIPEYQGLLKKAQDMRTTTRDFHYYVKCFRRAEFYKPLIISSMFFLITQFSGISAVTFYSMTIFQELFGPEMPGSVAMLLVDVLRLFWSLVTIFLMLYLSRRLLALISGVGVAFSLLFLSIYNLISNKVGVEVLIWVPILCVVLYISFMSVGFIPLPWCMLGELFSADNKGFAAGISTTVSYLGAFLVVNSLPYMFHWVGADGTFLTYGVFASLGTIYLFFFLPETKNKTFAEIEQGYKNTQSTSSTTTVSEII